MKFVILNALKGMIIPLVLLSCHGMDAAPLGPSDYTLLHWVFIWILFGGIVSHWLEKRAGWGDSRYLELWLVYFQRFFWPAPHPVLRATFREKLPAALATALVVSLTWVSAAWSLVTWAVVAPMLSRRQVDELIKINELEEGENLE